MLKAIVNMNNTEHADRRLEIWWYHTHKNNLLVISTLFGGGEVIVHQKNSIFFTRVFNTSNLTLILPEVMRNPFALKVKG